MLAFLLAGAAAALVPAREYQQAFTVEGGTRLCLNCSQVGGPYACTLWSPWLLFGMT